jgi:hypothetical protein
MFPAVHRWRAETRDASESVHNLSVDLTPIHALPSFLRKQESSAFTFNDLKALDPSFRWDDEQNQTFPSVVSQK